jgi:hypothetical protein
VSKTIDQKKLRTVADINRLELDKYCGYDGRLAFNKELTYLEFRRIRKLVDSKDCRWLIVYDNGRDFYLHLQADGFRRKKRERVNDDLFHFTDFDTTRVLFGTYALAKQVITMCGKLEDARDVKRGGEVCRECMIADTRELFERKPKVTSISGWKITSYKSKALPKHIKEQRFEPPLSEEEL